MKELHFADDELILSMPVRRALQYVKLVRRWTDPKCILANPSDRVRADWLEKENEALSKN